MPVIAVCGLTILNLKEVTKLRTNPLLMELMLCCIRIKQFGMPETVQVDLKIVSVGYLS